MAIWIIGYGIVQASAPALIVTVAGATPSFAPNVVVGGLLAFGVVFALNSSLHSCLILALSSGGRMTMDVGFR